jgi:hydrogenase nickel incorporation protein HypA/HybF
MHETMIAQSLLAAIAQEVAKLPNAKPVRAKVSCGKLYAINDEVLHFAFDAVAKGTPCQGVKIEFQTLPLEAMCKKCGKKFDLDIECIEQKCTHCGNDDYDVQPDAPLTLEQVQFEQEESC